MPGRMAVVIVVPVSYKQSVKLSQLQHVGLTGGVSPASNCFGSSVCQRQSAYHQKLVFRCGEMAVFKHAYDVSLTWVLLSSVNITFIFSKKWMLGATLTGVCCRDTFAFWALFFIDVSKAKSHDQKGVFRRGEMTIFKHGYVVSLTFTGVCCGDTFACWALFFTCLPSTRHLQNISHDWLCQSCGQWIERTPS